MAAVLLMVGRRHEPPEIVQQLLDVKRRPCKPQYNMANEVRLQDGFATEILNRNASPQ